MWNTKVTKQGPETRGQTRFRIAPEPLAAFRTLDSSGLIGSPLALGAMTFAAPARRKIWRVRPFTRWL